MFRKLSDSEAEQFRQWARDVFEPGMAIQVYWHPVVRAELHKLAAEAAEREAQALPEESDLSENRVVFKKNGLKISEV